jgi:hypothetical protein
MLAEILLVFVKKVTFEALKFWQGFLPSNPPKDRYGLEIFRPIITKDESFGHA